MARLEPDKLSRLFDQGRFQHFAQGLDGLGHGLNEQSLSHGLSLRAFNNALHLRARAVSPFTKDGKPIREVYGHDGVQFV